MKSKYNELVDKIRQEPGSLQRIHDNIDNMMDQQADSYVQIEKAADEYKPINKGKEKRRDTFLIAKAAAGFILVIFTVTLILYGRSAPKPEPITGNTNDHVLISPTPFEEVKKYPDEEGVKQTKDGVAELFMEGGPLYNTEYIEEDCYNITKKEIKDKTGATIVVFRETGAALCIYNGEVFVLSEGNGLDDSGDSISDMECTDLDKNGKYELVFTSVLHGSGLVSYHTQVLDLDTTEIKAQTVILLRRIYLLKENEEKVLVYSKSPVEEKDLYYLVYDSGEFKFIEIEDAETRTPGPTPTPTESPKFYVIEHDIDNDGVKEHFGLNLAANGLLSFGCEEYGIECVFSKESSDYFMDAVPVTSYMFEDFNNDNIDEVVIIGYSTKPNGGTKALFVAMKDGKLTEFSIPRNTLAFTVKENSPGQYILSCTDTAWSTVFDIAPEFMTQYSLVTFEPGGTYEVYNINNKKVLGIRNIILIQGEKYTLLGEHIIYLSYDGDTVTIEEQTFTPTSYSYN